MQLCCADFDRYSGDCYNYYHRHRHHHFYFYTCIEYVLHQIHTVHVELCCFVFCLLAVVIYLFVFIDDSYVAFGSRDNFIYLYKVAEGGDKLDLIGK